jgi:hypothetical protein
MPAARSDGQLRSAVMIHFHWRRSKPLPAQTAGGLYKSADPCEARLL